jgi:WD40 repeat protein
MQETPVVIHIEKDTNPLKKIMVLLTNDNKEEEHYDVQINEVNFTAEFLGQTCLTKWDLYSGKMLWQKEHKSVGWAVKFHKLLSTGVTVSRHDGGRDSSLDPPDRTDRTDDDHSPVSNGGDDALPICGGGTESGSETSPVDLDELSTEFEYSMPDIENFYVLKDGVCIKEVPGHASECWDCVEMPDRTFVTASHDRSIKLWDLDTFECKQSVINHVSSQTSASEFHTLKILENGNLVSGDYTGNLIVWKYPEMTILYENSDFRTLPDGGLIWGCDVYENRIAVGGDNGKCALFTDKLELLKYWTAHDNNVRTCVFLRNGFLCTGGYDDYLRVWNIDTLECLHEMHHAYLKPRFVRLMTNGWIVVGGWSNEIDIYDSSMYYGRTHFYNSFFDMDPISDLVVKFR